MSQYGSAPALPCNISSLQDLQALLGDSSHIDLISSNMIVCNYVTDGLKAQKAHSIGQRPMYKVVSIFAL